MEFVRFSPECRGLVKNKNHLYNYIDDRMSSLADGYMMRNNHNPERKQGLHHMEEHAFVFPVAGKFIGPTYIQRQQYIHLDFLVEGESWAISHQHFGT